MDTMAVIECILVDPHSSANCERGGRYLKQILTAYRKSMYDITIDEEMRVAMNGPHERAIKWGYYTKRWLNVLSKSRAVCRDRRATGTSQVVERLKKTAQKKDYIDLKCSFYGELPPQQ